MAELGPDKVIDATDPGDETGRRFRYQYRYAAIQALRLLADENAPLSVICENHEDVIVKIGDTKFVAIQVKTREHDQEPFKAYDDAIKKALTRFAKLESKFSDQIVSYELVTNFQFWKKEETKSNLLWLLESLAKRGNIKGLKKANDLRILVETISEASEVPAEVVVKALLKVKLTARNESLRTAMQDLRSAISEMEEFEDVPHKTVGKAAERLEEMAMKASTKELKGSVLDLYKPGSDFNAILSEQALAGKIIQPQNVRECLDAAIQEAAQTEPVGYAELLPNTELPKDLDVMVKKMAAGDLEDARIDQMKTVKNSFDHLFLKWSRRYGSKKARVNYETVMSKVVFECTEAQVEAQKQGEPYGSEMYSKLLARLKILQEEPFNQVLKCDALHFMGAAAILTQECKAWWSKKFDVQEKKV